MRPVTVVSFLSVNGAPGVTTLACLVGASWPAARPVLVVEADPWGGDLAPRFGLSSKSGWSSLATAARRGDGAGGGIRPHLQALPGGLEVLVGTDAGPDAARHRSWAGLAPFLDADEPRPDILVDLGRWMPGDPGADEWLRRSDQVVVVVWAEVASVLRVGEQASALTELTGAPVGLAVVTYGPLAGADIERFTGLPVLAELPFDPVAASVASGRDRAGRRLARSQLAAAAHRLAAALAGPLTPAPAAAGGDPADRVVELPRRVSEDPRRELVGSRPIGEPS
jgi:MinD-like ATPase involved in chromosome partitioning or flagellar assembly